MCGRFTLRTPSASWCQLFLPDIGQDQAVSLAEDLGIRPRYNVAPTQSIPCVARKETGAPRDLFLARWGLLPSWADDLAIGNRMINARGETVDSKPSFKRAFAKRRCLIPADGYYEWMKTDDGKQPYLIERPDHGMLAMAGLWEVNKKLSDDAAIVSCTIITTNANNATSAIHDRMPVFLRKDDYDVWLDPGFADAEKLKAMLAPADENLLHPTAVSRRVNSPRHDDEECIKPIDPKPKEQSLFD